MIRENPETISSLQRDSKTLSDSNVVLTIGRLVLQGIMAIAVTFGGWMINRAVNAVDIQSTKIDSIRDEVVKHTTSLAVLNNGMDADRTQHAQQFRDISDLTKDHETRIRTLEQKPTR